MLGSIKRIKLYVKDTDKAHSIEKIVKNELIKNGFEIDDNSYDMAISIGGDGTFLKMIHGNNFNNNIYYASINAGSLGFLSSINKSDVVQYIRNLNNGSFIIREIPILNTSVYINNRVDKYFSLNELTIRKTDFSTLKSNVLINEKLFEKYNGDGLVISTTTGSTAYSMALNGPIIDNDFNALAIIPIAPIINKVYKALNNSLIVSSNKKITLIPKNRNNLCFLNDGIMHITTFDKIECRLSDEKIKCIVPTTYNYIDNIKTKIIDNGD